jgi:hypothetical protein
MVVVPSDVLFVVVGDIDVRCPEVRDLVTFVLSDGALSWL